MSGLRERSTPGKDDDKVPLVEDDKSKESNGKNKKSIDWTSKINNAFDSVENILAAVAFVMMVIGFFIFMHRRGERLQNTADPGGVKAIALDAVQQLQNSSIKGIAETYSLELDEHSGYVQNYIGQKTKDMTLATADQLSNAADNLRWAADSSDVGADATKSLETETEATTSITIPPAVVEPTPPVVVEPIPPAVVAEPEIKTTTSPTVSPTMSVPQQPRGNARGAQTQAPRGNGGQQPQTGNRMQAPVGNGGQQQPQMGNRMQAPVGNGGQQPQTGNRMQAPAVTNAPSLGPKWVMNGRMWVTEPPKPETAAPKWVMNGRMWVTEPPKAEAVEVPAQGMMMRLRA